MIEIDDREFRLFQEYLLDKCGIDIPAEKRYLFNTRLIRVLSEKQCASFGALYALLQDPAQQELHNQIVEVMTTNETAFFRDTHPFDALKQVILPAIGTGKKAGGSFLTPRLCVWSAACSTGQEPYSIAMVVSDWLALDKTFDPANVRIIATDISARVLKKAAAGVYSDTEILKGMKDEYKARYFKKNGSQWQITDKIRRMVDFRQLNLSGSFFPDLINLDLIFCRNTIIYFSEKVKARIVEQFYRLLNPGGVLLLGAAENLYGITDKFEAVHAAATTFYRVKGK